MPFLVEIHVPSKKSDRVSNFHYHDRSEESDYDFANDMTYGTTLFPFPQMN